MVVAAAAGDQVVFPGQPGQMTHGVLIVLGVIHLHTQQACLLQAGDAGFQVVHECRMGQNGHPADFLNHLNALGRGHLGPFGVGQAVTAQVFVKGVFGLFAVAGFHHSQGDVGPPHRAVAGEVQDPLPLDMDSQGVQLLHHHLGPVNASAPKFQQLGLEIRVLIFQEVTQNVDLVPGYVGAHLDPRYDPQTGEFLGGLVGLRQPIGGVMVGDRHGLKSLLGHQLNQLGGGETAVRRQGV